MITIKPGSHIHTILTILTLVGEFPMASLGLLGSVRSYGDLIRKLTNLSLPDIGKEFARDHSTVLYAIRKVETELKKGDTNLQNNIRDITANINSLL